jgi:hypothetical protein
VVKGFKAIFAAERDDNSSSCRDERGERGVRTKPPENKEQVKERAREDLERHLLPSQLSRRPSANKKNGRANRIAGNEPENGPDGARIQPLRALLLPTRFPEKT